MLRLEGVTKRYDGQKVVDTINLNFGVGQTCALIGPSGCGKSTILKLLIGLIDPDEGQIFLENEPLAKLDPLSYRKRFGYVIQSGGLFPHLTARQNVLLAAQSHGNRISNFESRIRELLELTQFPEEGLDRFPFQLSGGQCQRVSLMRALILDPDVLLFDEPLGALDPMIRADLQNELVAIFKALNKTVVLVTHDLQEADLFADHIFLLNQGRLVQQGSLKNLVDSPATPFVTRFVRAQHLAVLTNEESEASE